MAMSPDLTLSTDGARPLCLGPSSLVFTLPLLNSWGSVTVPSSSVSEVTASAPLGPAGTLGPVWAGSLEVEYSLVARASGNLRSLQSQAS